MKVDLSFWRFVIIIFLSKSLTWGKEGETYLIHVATISNGKDKALSIILLPILIHIGFIGDL